jgi:hypothetical protein
MVGKLHEILAVEGDHKKVAEEVINEAINTLSKKADHFIGKRTEIQHFKEEDRPLDTVAIKEMVTTVPEKLEYVGEMVTRWYDSYLEKETTNQTAKADVIINGNVFLKDVPVIVLLGMEQRLKDLRNVYSAAPTLAPGLKWQRDPTGKQGQYFYENRGDAKFGTKKVFKAFVKAPATDKHPAQVDTYTEDEKISRITESVWSGCLSVNEKSHLIDRVDELIQAFKKARQRANDAEIVKSSMGAKIFEFLHGPLTKA